MKQYRNMVEEEFDAIAHHEQKHWWYKSLHHMVLDTLRKHQLPKNGAILDAGCGTGGLLQILEKQGYTNVHGFDISEKAIGYCYQKKLNVVKGDLLHINQLYLHHSQEAIVCNDVLYFLTVIEQISLMNQMFDLLKPNGLVIINYPAIKWFSGWHDKQVGIEERTSIKQFAKLINPRKFEIREMKYWPFLLSPLIWLIRFLQKALLKSKVENKRKSDLKTEPFLLNTLCYGITLLENRVIPQKPFGSSLFIVLKKIHHD